MTCLFCKLISGELPCIPVYEDANVFAFPDIEPQAPVHILIVPKKHIATLNDATTEDMHYFGDIYSVAKKLAAQNNIAESGYRIVMNCNENGGQSIFHIHAHLLGGRALHWPPG